MAYTNYSATIKCRNGFGYTTLDISTVGAVYSMLVTDGGGRPLESGTIVNIYDGEFELDALIPGNMVLQYIPYGFAQYFVVQFLYGDVTSTVLTAAVESPSKKDKDIYFTVSVYRP